MSAQHFQTMRQFKIITTLAGALALFSLSVTAKNETGFTPIFDGKTLNGWVGLENNNANYFVKDGVIVCPKEDGGNLFTEKEYSDFILRLDFKLTPGANNGIGIRAPFDKGQIAYFGNEVQVLDDTADEYKNLEAGQYCGSLYKIFPAKRGALKKVGAWNSYEITAQGRHIKVVLNGKTITEGNINDVSDPAVIRRHPGMLRDKGRIGFLGHHSLVEFRNIRVKELSHTEPENTPPEGFAALFNGKDLSGWKGLVADPPHRAKMSAEDLATAQTKADQSSRDHWKADDGAIVFDGHGQSLCTSKDYGNFEMLVDWKIPPKGDSGIYIRGSPQVQIWEANSPGHFTPFDGSGGLYNNNTAPRHPIKAADHPVGEWNRFRILMVGEKVHVFLNGELVVNDTTMENYWERAKPIYPSGQIELQNHGGPLWFKNIYVREIHNSSAK